jgi:hypothetical protein
MLVTANITFRGFHREMPEKGIGFVQVRGQNHGRVAYIIAEDRVAQVMECGLANLRVVS